MSDGTDSRRCPPAVRDVSIQPASHHRLSDDSLTPIALAACLGEMVSMERATSKGEGRRDEGRGGQEATGTPTRWRCAVTLLKSIAPRRLRTTSTLRIRGAA